MTLTCKPAASRFHVFGCRHNLEFPTAKLLDRAGREDKLLADDNPFALVTAARLLTRATRQDMDARLAAKWRFVRVLFERGWDRQRVVDLFAVIDWMMRSPDDMAHELLWNIAAFEERTKMPYVTSVERIGIEKGRQEGWHEGRQEGRQEGKAALLLCLLERRFGDLPDWARDRVRSADCAMLETWSVRLLEAASVEEVLR